MKYDPNRHHRRSIRLRGWDYAGAGAYFVTLVTYNRECLFGQVVDGKVVLSPWGEIVAEEWRRTADVRSNVRLDEFVVMPNHVHGIIWIIANDDETAVGATNVGAHSRAPLPLPHRPPKSLGAIIAGFKSIVTKRINIARGTPGMPVWQRNYYERIIRNERALRAVRQYIQNNPLHWAHDMENPNRNA